MDFKVNGQTRSLPSGSTVRALLEELRLADTPCAVEINERLVPHRLHVQTELHEGDRVEVVTLVGGG